MNRMCRCLCLLATLTLTACAGDPEPQPRPTSSQPGPTDSAARSPETVIVVRSRQRGQSLVVDVDADQATVADVMDAISECVGRPIQVDPVVQARVTTSLADLPWRDAVDAVAEMSGCRVEDRGDVLLLTQP